MCIKKNPFKAALVLGLLVTSSGPLQAQLEQLRDSHFYPRDTAREELGKLLMFDKILSGNRNISCASCHHPLTGTSDGLSLPIGEGGSGLSVMRTTGADSDAVHERVPRNSPALFNLGAREFSVMFHDGRLQVDPTQPSGFFSPAGDQLPQGLDNVLAAQAMFPVTSGTEMAGQPGENAVAFAAADSRLAGDGGVWDLLAARLRAIDEYVELFKQAFPGQIRQRDDIRYVHVANAIAAFEAATFRCTNSPFDRFVNGNADLTHISERALRGGMSFYQIGCSDCHSGQFQTDHRFHAIGVPQIGPGKGDALAGNGLTLDDLGRERVSGDPADRYRFRTPSLRQVAQTGPWGHDGAYDSLEAMVRHHLDAYAALDNYSLANARLPARVDLTELDGIAHNDLASRDAIAAAIEIAPMTLSDAQVGDLVSFLEEVLTDPACIDLTDSIPSRVPSGLPVAD